MDRKKLKFAFVKQETYQDLYVVDISEKSAYEILKSSIMRIGPIGMFVDLNTDFIIVNEDFSEETQVYKNVLPEISNYSDLIKTGQFDKIPGHEFLEPGTNLGNNNFSKDSRYIDWSKYDIVISVNVSIKSSIIRKFKNTLFCYMISEVNMYLNYAHFGYDLTLIQSINGRINSNLGISDFPYTFLNSSSLKTLLSKSIIRSGIFVEINSCSERPVTNIPEAFEIIQKYTKMSINLHHQNVLINLNRLFQSKYYVKFGGRITRGNGALEAISAGCLVIIRKSEIKYDKIVLSELQFENLDDLINLIIKLEEDEKFYLECLNRQGALLDKYAFDLPLSNLISELNKKRSNYFVYYWKRKLFICLYLFKRIYRKCESFIYK